MYCTNCDRESKNLRVCPFCFTPYPQEGASARRPSLRQNSPDRSPPSPGPMAQGRALLERAKWWVMLQTPLVRYVGAAIIVVIVLWAFTGSDEPPIVETTAPSTLVVTAADREQAAAFIRATRETALVDVQRDEIFVSYPAASFPVRDEGQIELARRFARADEIVEGRKRRIFFYNPNGKLFAQSDAVRGLVVVP